MAQHNYIVTTGNPDAIGAETVIAVINEPAGTPYVMRYAPAANVQPNWNALPLVPVVFGGLAAAVQTLLLGLAYNPDPVTITVYEVV